MSRKAAAQQAGVAQRVVEEDASCWHPAWGRTQAQEDGASLPAAKRRRLLKISQLYESLRAAVVDALIERQRREKMERALTADIAKRFPLQERGPHVQASEKTPQRQPPVLSPTKTKSRPQRGADCSREGVSHVRLLHVVTSPASHAGESMQGAQNHCCDQADKLPRSACHANLVTWPSC